MAGTVLVIEDDTDAQRIFSVTRHDGHGGRPWRLIQERHPEGARPSPRRRRRQVHAPPATALERERHDSRRMDRWIGLGGHPDGDGGRIRRGQRLAWRIHHQLYPLLGAWLDYHSRLVEGIPVTRDVAELHMVAVRGVAAMADREQQRQLAPARAPRVASTVSWTGEEMVGFVVTMESPIHGGSFSPYLNTSAPISPHRRRARSASYRKPAFQLRSAATARTAKGKRSPGVAARRANSSPW